MIWMFITGSRLPSQWLGGQVGHAAQALEEGNSLDRIVYFSLILLAIAVLISRSFPWADFFARNPAFTVLLFYALLSVLWSDFPWIAFKRWFRDLGNYLAILVVLSDARPLEAVRTVLRYVSFLLIPLSIVLIKYYPQLGKQYSYYTGAGMYVGVATSKNMLGVACLISGLFFFWDTVTRWTNRRERRTRQVIFLNLAFLAMTLLLLNLSRSATSSLCLVLGWLVIAAAHSRMFKTMPALLKVMIPVMICLYLTLSFGLGLDINGALADAVGRDPTLTGRSNIWSAVLAVHTNPLVGTGYETFWLGPRLQKVWALTGAGINEAHNGYLEVYLNLGLLGILLLFGFLISSYRTICKRLAPFSSFGSLSLAFWAIVPFYNVTESAFRGQLMWTTFLLAAIVIPRSTSVRLPSVQVAPHAPPPSLRQRQFEVWTK